MSSFQEFQKSQKLLVHAFLNSENLIKQIFLNGQFKLKSWGLSQQPSNFEILFFITICHITSSPLNIQFHEPRCVFQAYNVIKISNIVLSEELEEGEMDLLPISSDIISCYICDKTKYQTSILDIYATGIKAKVLSLHIVFILPIHFYITCIT